MRETVDHLSGHLEELRGDYICISNVHTTVMAFRDESYRMVQNSGAMALPDGKPLSIVQRKRGYYQAERVPGPDLMPELIKTGLEKGWRHYFYGSNEDTLASLKTNLEAKFPGICIAGMYSPPFRPLTEKEDLEIVERINAAKPDFIWVALGAPKQERWMYEHKGRVTGLMLGVGAGFDFHAGTIKRAPKWIQEMCLEWLYRIFQDPKRLLPRYLSTNFAFLKEAGRETRAVQNERRRSGEKRLKIAMIGHKRVPSREGGVEIVVEQLSKRLVRQGHRVVAYNRHGEHIAGKKFNQKQMKRFEGIKLITIPTPKSSALNAIVYSFFATLHALFGGYDVIHYHAEGPCILLPVPKLFGIRVIATIHGLDWQRSKWGNFASKMLLLGERNAAKYADEVIVLSSNVQEYFRETYGRETHFIPNGIERPEKRPAKEIREKFGLEPDEYILFLARIVPEKGIHYLIEAFGRIETDKKLVIAGGKSHSFEYMDMIHEMAAKDDRVIMTDFVAGTLLEELYSNAYLFVLPSDVEGMALSLLEAMSYGNACLVSDIPENTEVVEDHGMTFAKGDVDDLEEKLKDALSHPEEVREYASAAADYICGKYNWDDVTRETARLYFSGKDR